MADGVVDDFNSKWIATDQIDGMYEYLRAIDWSQRWLMALMTGHVLILFLIILNRNRTNILVGIFALLLISVYFSEKLNVVAARNWSMFATEQYFDSPGLFISVIYSTPMLFNSLIIIVIWLWDSSKMISVVTKHRRKRVQRAQEMSQRGQSTPDGDDATEKKDK